VTNGRPPATSCRELERRGFELFARHGFGRTTVEDIATAAGIGRRTFFRYFASKNDLVWGDFEAHLARLEQLLASAEKTFPLMDALRGAIIEFNCFDPAEVPWHRQRMELILTVPALQADATLRYAAWRGIVAGFAATRLGLPPGHLTPRLIGHAALGAALTAYECWLAEPGSDLAGLLDEAMRGLAVGRPAGGP
jgi:mycofactocin system transcriptional regulator